MRRKKNLKASCLGALRSWTMWVNFLSVLFLAVGENLPLLANLFGGNYQYVALSLGVVNIFLRIKTTKSLKER